MNSSAGRMNMATIDLLIKEEIMGSKKEDPNKGNKKNGWTDSNGRRTDGFRTYECVYCGNYKCTCSK